MKNSLRHQTGKTWLYQSDGRRGGTTIADGQLKEEDDRRPLNKINRPAPGNNLGGPARPLLLLGRIIRSSQSDTGTPSAGRGLCWKTSITLRSATRLVKVNCFVTRENCDKTIVCGPCCCGPQRIPVMVTLRLTITAIAFQHTFNSCSSCLPPSRC